MLVKIIFDSDKQFDFDIIIVSKFIVSEAHSFYLPIFDIRVVFASKRKVSDG